MYILTNDKQNKEHDSVITEQAGKQMPMPARQRERGYRMEVLPEAHGRSSDQREPPPKTCTQESYGAREKDRERSVRIRSDSTSSSLCARELFPPHLPPFIDQEGSRSGINFLPTKSNYLGSTYVPNSLLYTTKNVRARRAGPRCRGIPRGCVEVGRDHGGLEPRKPKGEEE